METNRAAGSTGVTRMAQDMAYQSIDLEDAVSFLQEDFPVRRVDEVVADAIRWKAQEEGCSEDQVKERLRGPLGAQNLRNWLTPGKVKRLSRESAMKFAFALEMTYEQADHFLKRCWLDGFYMRDLQDLIYRYGLEHGWSYEKAAKEIAAFPTAQQPNENPDGNGQVEQEGITQFIQSQYTALQSEEDLHRFIERNMQLFGSYRRKIYQIFMQQYHDLKALLDDTARMDRREDGQGRETVSESDVLGMILGALSELSDQKKLNPICSRLVANLPGRTGLAEIIHQSDQKGKIAQADRKLLLLAYLAGIGGEKFEYSSRQDVQEAFMEHLTMINEDLLEPLGMALLDPRHPFDWIVMNAVRCTYFGEQTDITERMNDLIDQLAKMERED